MKVVIQQSLLEPYVALERYQREALAPGKFGAAVTFVGLMRDFHQDHDVTSMVLEHYPGMTERQIEQVCREAADRWNILDTLVVHRVGEIFPNDAIVLVAVWSAHRAEGFDACRYIINYLKQRAPFWKQETGSQLQHWVEGNTEDPGAALPSI